MDRKSALAQLSLELKEKLGTEKERGLKDVKALCSRSDASAHQSVWALNNALKVCDDSDVKVYAASQVNEALEQFRIK